MKNINIRVDDNTSIDAALDLFVPVLLGPTDNVLSVQLVKDAGFTGSPTLTLQQSNFPEEVTFSTMNIGGTAAEGTVTGNSLQIERLDPVTSPYLGVKYTSNGSTGTYKINVCINQNTNH